MLLDTYGVRDRLVAPGPVAGALEAQPVAATPTLFVLPSRGEAMPVAVLEALRAGCPVIISTGCSLPEVETAGAGLVVDATSEAFAQAIASLLSDDPRRRLMASRAAQLARVRFDWRAIRRTHASALPGSHRRLSDPQRLGAEPISTLCARTKTNSLQPIVPPRVINFLSTNPRAARKSTTAPGCATSNGYPPSQSFQSCTH